MTPGEFRRKQMRPLPRLRDSGGFLTVAKAVSITKKIEATMAQRSEIEWTDATWNPVTGCTKIGPGCDNCYAERFAERWRGIEGHPYEQGFDLRLWPSRLDQPARWKKPRMIFVNSMSDLFHKDIPISHIDAVFDAMERANWHVYQALPSC